MQKLFDLKENKEICANCEYYHMHYVRFSYRAIGIGKVVKDYMPCNCGHCSFKRLRKRSPQQTCEHFRKVEVE